MSHRIQENKMNSLEMKIARHEISDAKQKLSVAQCAHETEVKALEEAEKALGDGFHAKVPMERFLQLRESKRIQARVVRETFRALVDAMNVLDDAETKYDLLVSAHSR
jgi:hypothetical protein